MMLAISPTPALSVKPRRAQADIPRYRRSESLRNPSLNTAVMASKGGSTLRVRLRTPGACPCNCSKRTGVVAGKDLAVEREAPDWQVKGIGKSVLRPGR